MSKSPEIRSKLKHLINVSESSGDDDYALVNEGVTELTEEFNPDTDTIQYVADENKTTVIKSYAPSISITMSIVKDDKVNKYLRKKIDELPLGDKADTSYIRFNVMDVKSGGDNEYVAYKREAIISVDSIGGSAEDYLGASLTLNGKGNATKGTLKVTKGSDGKVTYTFTADETTTSGG